MYYVTGPVKINHVSAKTADFFMIKQNVYYTNAEFNEVSFAI